MYNRETNLLSNSYLNVSSHEKSYDYTYTSKYGYNMEVISLAVSSNNL